MVKGIRLIGIMVGFILGLGLNDCIDIIIDTAKKKTFPDVYSNEFSEETQ